MKIYKKYLVRRNLDSYSEMVFGDRLNRHGHEIFYPFKDKGIDLVSIHKENKTYFYQLKARSINQQGGYWFMVNIKKLEKFPKTNESFWVFCCFDGNVFDFFQVPLKVVKKWFSLYHNSEGVRNKHEQYFLKITPISKGKYKISPDWLNSHINIMNFLLKK